MELKQVILELRKERGLSQEEMAAKLFVTRQAVSRWENGETTPNIDTLKTISDQFGVSPGVLLGLEELRICQSCGTELYHLEDFGTDNEGGVHPDYCQYCLQNGVFSNERTIDEMVESNLRFLNEYNKEKGLSFTKEQARVELKSHLATLKRWK